MHPSTSLVTRQNLCGVLKDANADWRREATGWACEIGALESIANDFVALKKALLNPFLKPGSDGQANLRQHIATYLEQIKSMYNDTLQTPTKVKNLFQSELQQSVQAELQKEFVKRREIRNHFRKELRNSNQAWDLYQAVLSEREQQNFKDSQTVLTGRPLASARASPFVSNPAAGHNPDASLLVDLSQSARPSALSKTYYPRSRKWITQVNASPTHVWIVTDNTDRTILGTFQRFDAALSFMISSGL